MRTFAPSETGKMAGISVDTLHDWRRRGFLKRVGVRGKNGRWMYRVGDVVALAIMREISNLGLALGPAAELASISIPYVVAWFPSRRDESF